MKLLLDTHTFLWMDYASHKLPERTKNLLQDPNHDLFLSLANVWEMQIKVQLGKLQLRTALAKVIADQQQNGVTLLPITLSHILALQSLPPHHRDPFDRLLIAQAQMEGATLLSKDGEFSGYTVSVIWS